jgi:hypothetical protein
MYFHFFQRVAFHPAAILAQVENGQDDPTGAKAPVKELRAFSPHH